MTIETLPQPPALTDYVTYAEHQSHTPGSFFESKPVLHKRCSGCWLQFDPTSSAAATLFRALRAQTQNGDLAPANGGSNGETQESQSVVLNGIDAWVGSDFLLLINTQASKTARLTFPSIALHATQRVKVAEVNEGAEVEAVYMQIIDEAANVESDDDIETLELVLIPPQGSEAESQLDAPQGTNGHAGTQPLSLSQELYAALSRCSELHLDAKDETLGADGMGELGGEWFTAESMRPGEQADTGDGEGDDDNGGQGPTEENGAAKRRKLDEDQ